MKNKILYILAFIAVIFSSCNPLKDAINDIKPITADKTLTVTAAKTYESAALAKIGITEQLNSSFPQMGDGTKANVTYSFKTNTVKPADSVFANIQYTVTDADYQATNGNANKNFSAANALAFLESKYPLATSPANKLVLLSYAYFQSGVTPSAGTPTLDAFLLFESGWQKVYLVSAAQYASIGRGVNNAFATADATTVAAYLNSFLKADPTVMATVKVGDIKYISYKVFVSTSVSHQKVYMLTYDVTQNWVPSATLAFLKQKGKWIPDPTIYYTLTKADFVAIGNGEIGTIAARANAKSFGTFDITGGVNSWTDDEIGKALALFLKGKFPDAAADPAIPYKVTYAIFRSPPPTNSKLFIKTSTGFVLVPTE